MDEVFNTLIMKYSPKGKQYFYTLLLKYCVLFYVWVLPVLHEHFWCAIHGEVFIDIAISFETHLATKDLHRNLNFVQKKTPKIRSFVIKVSAWRLIENTNYRIKTLILVNNMVVGLLLLKKKNKKIPKDNKPCTNEHITKKFKCPTSASTSGVSDPTTNNIKHKFLPPTMMKFSRSEADV